MDMISKIKWDFSPEDVGILAPRDGLINKIMTVNTGVEKRNKVGQLEKIDNNLKTNIWKDEKCNEISGSDGSIYDYELIRKKSVVDVYIPEICRSLPMRFTSEVKH
jgi:hypothetical protein